MKNKFLFLLCAVIAFNGCAVKRHSVINQEENTTDLQRHTHLQTQFSMDSVLKIMDFSADSVVIVVNPPAQDVADASRGQSTSCVPASHIQPTIRITAHHPQLTTHEQQGSLTVTQTIEQDSATSQTITNSHADNSKEVVGVARPINSTLLIVLLAVLLIVAVVLLLYLRKRKVI